MDISKILNELEEDHEHYFGAVAPPLVQSSNFAFSSVEDFRKAVYNEQKISLYTRGKNPTTHILCKKLAALAGAEDALVFGSGSAAVSAAVISLVAAGDHIICQQHPYKWSEKLLTKILAKFGVEFTFVDGTDFKNFEAAVKPNTKLIYIESPNSFTFELQDIKAVVALAKKINAKTIIDNSYCTSLGQRCIEMGIDLEVHSLTKYYAGHSDVVAGGVIGSKELIAKIFTTGLQNIGGIISPHDSWLVLRGMRTLPVRMKQVAETTEKVIEFLLAHPRVEKVIYPFHESHPQYELAKKQMLWSGGLFSFILKAEKVEEVEAFANKLRAFKLAVSWGGYESLIYPACVAIQSESYKGYLPFNIIRTYCGLESAEYLIADLKQALE